jgi:hypothetical protein
LIQIINKKKLTTNFFLFLVMLQFQGSVTPRCLRRADSGVPMDEPIPRSESVTPESSAGGSPPENSNSSETSSGVHSNSSASQNSAKRSNSVDDLPMETERIQPSPWRSFSLQRGTQPPTSGIYGFTSMPPAPTITPIPETTVVIRRKQTRPKTTDLTQTNEPFERSTNMRMTSFTDQPDGTRKEECPYPTRAQLGFCHSFPRSMQYQPSNEIPQDGSRTLPTHTENLIRINENPFTNQTPPSLCHSFPRHTTIPTHHNGVRLFPQPAHTFAKRPIVHTRLQDVGGHHTFPHVGAVKYNPIPNPTHQMVARQDRDSANYSMASSGDSDSYLQQHS